jgi:hypothetical protein
MAGFAVDASVPSVFLFLENIGVAGLAGLVAGKVGRAGSYLRKGVAAVVAILSETAGDQKAADEQEQYQADSKD